MEELHEQRVDFVQKVQQVVSEDLLKNGLELESVSLTGLDQTGKEYFNPDNAFDAEGLTKLTEAIEERRKKRNDIEQDTEVAIANKNLESQRKKYDIAKEQEYARLEQEREVEIRRAAQAAEIKREQAEKSKAQSEAQAEADRARAVAVKEEEAVITVRDTQKAERAKSVELVEASKAAERRPSRSRWLLTPKSCLPLIKRKPCGPWQTLKRKKFASRPKGKPILKKCWLMQRKSVT